MEQSGLYYLQIKHMTSQLKLFEVSEQMFEVSYWAAPFDKKGNTMPWILQNWVEVVNKKKLQFLKEYCFKYSCNYFNVKIKEL